MRGNVVRRTGNPDGASPGAIGTRGGNGIYECNDVTIGGKVTAIVQIFSGGTSGDGDNNVIRWNRGGKVSIHGSQTGNVATDNTAVGYAAHCQ